MTNQKTKKCSYCAEEILDEAVVCKHCKSSLVDNDENQKTKKSTLNYKKTLKIASYITLALISINLWYIAIPIISLWYIWKRSKIQEKKKKFTYSGIVLLVFCIIWLSLGIASAQANKEPIITLTEPNDNQSVQTDNILIKGKIDPVRAVLIINDGTVGKDDNGYFQYEQPINEEKNFITIKAVNGKKTNTKTLTINRIFTEEEIKERQKLKAEEEAKRQLEIEAQKRAEEERVAREKAEQMAWDASKAGRICKKHPEWTKDDCTKLANNKFWIGMSIDMLKELRGLPDSANPSNYGYGTNWQWCWYDYTPSCFYDHNEDGLVDSYN